jgi:radical SAM superfamily enzyme YgiQ (UPF0313 family)
MKILLVQPPLNRHLVGAGTFYLNEPLALETVAAGVAEHDVRILDLRIDDGLSRELRTFQPDIVGVTAYTPDVYTVCGLCRTVKAFQPRILTVVGGHHATLFPGDFNTEGVDCVVMGDGDRTFRELVEAHRTGTELADVPGLAVRRGRQLVHAPARARHEFDRTPLPARHLTQRYRRHYFRGKWRPVASLVTSRGCPYRCNFCSVWKREQGAYRVYSAERVVREIESIEEQCISVGDDNFFHDTRRAEEICTLIRARGIRKTYKLIGRTDTIVRRPDLIRQWKEIGMDQVFVGLESFRDADLRLFKKTTSVDINDRAIDILHDCGVEVVGQFIIHPEFTADDFTALGDYVLEKRLSQPIFSVLTPLPGTDLYEQKEGELLTRNYEMYDLVHSVLPTRLPRESFYRHYADLYVRCYRRNGAEEALPGNILQSLYHQLRHAYTLQ